MGSICPTSNRTTSKPDHPRPGTRRLLGLRRHSVEPAVHWATKRRLFGQHRRIHVLAAIALACTVLGSAPAWAQPADSALSTEAASCKALQAADLSGIVDAPTQITETKLIAASEELPAYCRVLGYVATHVGIEMRLP